MLRIALALFGFLAVQEPTTLTGDWTLSLIGDHVMRSGLVLEQSGTKLVGTMFLMGKEAAAEGEFVDGVFTLSVKAEMRDAEGHAAPLKFVGKMQEDGTLAGDLDTPRGKHSWTAERLKKRK
jgi:hypothetical protein